MKKSIFGEIVDDVMVLNEMGEIVKAKWYEIPSHFAGVEVDSFVVMPNHVHGIVIILDEKDGAEMGLARHTCQCVPGASPLRESGASSFKQPRGPKRRS